MLEFVWLTLFLFTGVDCSVQWAYAGENGPDTWADLPGYSCGLKSQSPIDVDTSDVVVEEFAEWKMEGYNSGKVSKIENNGHSLKVSLEGNYFLSGGGLLGKYRAVQFHFHWGSKADQGSEHTVDATSYEAEMHIVHYNNSYINLTKAIDSGDATALAALGVFVKIGKENAGLKKVFDLAKTVPFKGNSGNMADKISLASILPKDLTRFYRYIGSLTTPGCWEIVAWTVFENTIEISAEQMSVLRGLHEGANNQSEEIVNNYRPVQPVNGRTVYFSAASTCNLPLLLYAIATVVALQYNS